MAQTGTVFAVGNGLLLSLYFEFPLLAYVLSYGGLLAIAAGGVAKVTKAVNVDDITAEMLFPKDAASCVMDFVHSSVSKCLEVALPVVLWQDVQVSLLAGLVMYIVGFWIMSWLSVSLLVLLTFNGLFIYGKFQDEILQVAGPHLEIAAGECQKYWAMIPRYKQAEKEQ
jgi:hypothetical protein